MLDPLWTCENCGDSGMTTFVLHCPQCQRYRPEKFDTYRGKGPHQPYSLPTYQYGVLGNGNVQNSLPFRARLQIPLSSSRLASECPLPQTISPLLTNLTRSAMPKKDDRGFESPAATDATPALSSAQTPDLIMDLDSELLHSYSESSPESIFTPTSTQEFMLASGPFSYQNYMNSETEFTTGDTESTEDTTDDENTIEPSDYLIDILDSHLFSILNPNLELASLLISKIHVQMQFRFGSETEVYSGSPSDGSERAQETHGDFRPLAFTPGNESRHNGSSRDKRGRGRERDESEDREDRSRLKKRRFRDPSAVPRPRFACHFNKKDSVRYCPLSNPKFNVCHGRGHPELRRMKAHYQNAHRPAQCERCYTIFEDRDELKDHRQAESPCHKKSDILKEGIDESQWSKIEPLFHVRRKLSPSQKEQDDIDKWFEIWDILFPTVVRPADPWVKVVPITSLVLPNDVEALLVDFNSLIERDIEQGVLQRDEEFHQRYIFNLRFALQEHAVVSAPAELPNDSFPEANELTDESVESPCERQTGVNIPDNFLRQPVSSHSSSQHLLISYQDQVSSQLSRSNPPSTEYDDLEGTDALQPSQIDIPPMSNVLDTSIFSESLFDLRDTHTSQPHLAVSSVGSSQSEALSHSWRRVESPDTSNIEQVQDSTDLFGDIEFPGELASNDLWLGDFSPFNANSNEIDRIQLHSDTLVELLESENDDPAVFVRNKDILG